MAIAKSLLKKKKEETVYERENDGSAKHQYKRHREKTKLWTEIQESTKCNRGPY